MADLLSFSGTVNQTPEHSRGSGLSINPCQVGRTTAAVRRAESGHGGGHSGAIEGRHRPFAFPPLGPFSVPDLDYRRFHGQAVNMPVKSLVLPQVSPQARFQAVQGTAEIQPITLWKRNIPEAAHPDPQGLGDFYDQRVSPLQQRPTSFVLLASCWRLASVFPGSCRLMVPLAAAIPTAGPAPAPGFGQYILGGNRWNILTGIPPTRTETWAPRG